MKLNRLKIVNFRNHSSTDLDLSEKINLFIGPNATGKTTVVDALAFLFTGTNARTSKSGEGMNEVVTFGESRALVGAEIDTIGKITRTIPHTFQIADWEGTMTAQTNQLYDQFGISKDGILCSVYSTKFLDMSPDEQKNFMFKLMGLSLDQDVVEKEFEIWCKANNIEKLKEIWTYVLNNFSFNGDTSTFDNIYKECGGIRRTLKREIKRLETVSNERKSNLPEGITIEHRDSVISKLTELRDKRDKLFVSLGQARSQQKVIADLKEKISKESTIEVPKETQDDVRTKLEEIKQNSMKIQRSIANHESEEKQALSTIDKLNTFDGKCPLSSAISCKITKEEVQQLVDKFNKKKASILGKLTEERETLDKIRFESNKWTTILEKRVRADILLPEIQNAKKQLQELTGQDSPNLTVLGDEIRKIDERITKGQTILTAIEADTANEKNRIAASRDFERKKNELKIIEVVMEAFGPKGLKSTMLNRAIKPIESKASERFSILTDGKYSIEFRVDEENFNIYIISEGIERRIKHLSASEKLRVGVIMQDAINELVGSKLLVIDEVDILDKENRKLFWNLIHKIKDNYDSIIVLATGTEVVAMNKPGLRVYKLGERRRNDLF